MKNLNFDIIKEEKPGEKFRHLFEKNWPAYRAWYLDEGETARPTYLECVGAIKRHMPELFPLYKDLLSLLDADDLKARFLSLYQPPPFYSGCSQLITKTQSPVLIRNYDFPPILCEGTVLYSQWLDKRVIAMADCVWGALDGINDEGLAVSIAYGGQLRQGDGFGITIVMRYVLETCTAVEEAIETFKRIPIHLDYNIALVDKAGNHATLFIVPGEEVCVTRATTSTNHQGAVNSDTTLFLEDSQVRLDALNALSTPQEKTLHETATSFLQRPLYRPHDIYQSGTLYTAAYRPAQGEAIYLWPNQNLTLSFDDFTEQQKHIFYQPA